jgi:hypothetical protein
VPGRNYGAEEAVRLLHEQGCLRMRTRTAKGKKRQGHESECCCAFAAHGKRRTSLGQNTRVSFSVPGIRRMHGVSIEMQAGKAWFALLQGNGRGNALGRQTVLVNTTQVTTNCCASMLWRARGGRTARPGWGARAFVAGLRVGRAAGWGSRIPRSENPDLDHPSLWVVRLGHPPKKSQVLNGPF